MLFMARSLTQLAPEPAEVSKKIPSLKKKMEKSGKMNRSVKKSLNKAKFTKEMQCVRKAAPAPTPPCECAKQAGREASSPLGEGWESQRDQERGASQGRDKQTSSQGVSSRSTTALENSAQLTQIRRTALFLGSLQCFTLQLHSRPAPVPPAAGEVMPRWTGKAFGRLWMCAVGICGRASPGKIYIYLLYLF